MSDILKRFGRHSSQYVCPWNVRFSRGDSEPVVRAHAAWALAQFE